MGAVRTLGLATAVKGTPTPAVLAAAYYTSSNLATPGVVIGTSSFSIKNGIATVVLNTALPTNGYNGPNGYPGIPTASPATATQSQNIVPQPPLNIQGTFPAPNGQQVTLWGFTTAPFNGKKVSVISCDTKKNSFSFYFNNADVSSTVDTTGLTAPSPFQHYRVVRLELGANIGSDLIYVGDLNVSSTQYMTVLSAAGRTSIEIASENIPPEGIFLDTSGTSSGDQVAVSCIY